MGEVVGTREDEEGGIRRWRWVMTEVFGVCVRSSVVWRARAGGEIEVVGGKGSSARGCGQCGVVRAVERLQQSHSTTRVRGAGRAFRFTFIYFRYYFGFTVMVTVRGE